MSKKMQLSLTDTMHTSLVHKALSSDVRLKILSILGTQNRCVNELAQMLGIPASTAALHVRVLEEAGLIFTERQPGTRGMSKMCCRLIDDVETLLDGACFLSHDPARYITYSLPIGSFADCELQDYCGLLTERGPVGKTNYPHSFFLPERAEAQLMWFRHGFFEYRVSTLELERCQPKSLRISFEACSEVAFYNMNWPSDIYVSVNGHELGVWTSPGDFGDRHGILTPSWWGGDSTQYGKLKTWLVTEEGVQLDGIRIGDVAIDDLRLNDMPYFTLRIGVHSDAENVGGMNLFGCKFGDFAQDILVQIGMISAH